jgi:hypothetical protein
LTLIREGQQEIALKRNLQKNTANVSIYPTIAFAK